MTQEVIEPTRTDKGKGIKHAVCPVCTINAKPGDPVLALCGVRRKKSAKTTKQVPSNACVVCLDLSTPHIQEHLRSLT